MEQDNIRRSTAGIRGDKIRSDCYIELELKKSGGLKISVKSKVSALYGDSISGIISDMCRFFQVKNASILIEDYGALPFCLAARFELALKRLRPDMQDVYLPLYNKNYNYRSSKERLRRSRLYLPGNEPKFFVNAGLHKPDGIILDLEDSVSHAEKDAARLMVRNALVAVDFYGAERMVRINQLPMGKEDLRHIVPYNVHVILIPKCESAEEVFEVENEIIRIKNEYKIKNDIWFMPIIESAKGIINAYEIASASTWNCALAIGLEDYTSDIGTQRTLEGRESFFARSMIVNAAKAAGIQAIDTVFSDVNDMESLRLSVLEAKSMGFEGKGCIHPRQIPVVHESFAPSPEEIAKALRIVAAYEDAEAKGLGVVSLGSKMIDAPVVKRARRTVDLARTLGLIKEILL